MEWLIARGRCPPVSMGVKTLRRRQAEVIGGTRRGHGQEFGATQRLRDARLVVCQLDIYVVLDANPEGSYTRRRIGHLVDCGNRAQARDKIWTSQVLTTTRRGPAIDCERGSLSRVTSCEGVKSERKRSPEATERVTYGHTSLVWRSLFLTRSADKERGRFGACWPVRGHSRCASGYRTPLLHVRLRVCFTSFSMYPCLYFAIATHLARKTSV